MNGYIIDSRYARILDVPLSFSQTELRSGNAITVCEFTLDINQRVEIRSLTITLNAVLTPGVIPVYLNTTMELCSVGVYRGTMICSPFAYAAYRETACTVNPFARHVIETPGDYKVIVSNNMLNVDLSVTATGSFKFYY